MRRHRMKRLARNGVVVDVMLQPCYCIAFSVLAVNEYIGFFGRGLFVSSFPIHVASIVVQ